MTINERVKAILGASHAARNSDKELWLIYAQKSGVNLSAVQIEAIRKMPEFETLRRVRQKIQATGLHMADDKVYAARMEKASKVRQTIPWMEDKDVEYTLDGRRILPFGK